MRRFFLCFREKSAKDETSWQGIITVFLLFFSFFFICRLLAMSLWEITCTQYALKFSTFSSDWKHSVCVACVCVCARAWWRELVRVCMSVCARGVCVCCTCVFLCGCVADTLCLYACFPREICVRVLHMSAFVCRCGCVKLVTVYLCACIRMGVCCVRKRLASLESTQSYAGVCWRMVTYGVCRRLASLERTQPRLSHGGEQASAAPPRHTMPRALSWASLLTWRLPWKRLSSSGKKLFS